MGVEHPAIVLDLETGSRRVSAFPSRYGDGCGAAVDLGWRATATADHPARLRAEVRNFTDFPAEFRGIPLFGGRSSFTGATSDRGSNRRKLHLFPTEDHPLAEDPPAYERGPEGHWRSAGPPPGGPSSIVLDPGESVVGEYYLLADRDAESPAEGRYSFELAGTGGGYGFTVAVWDPDRPGPTGESRFEGTSHPSLPRWGSSVDSTGTAWYHEAGPETELSLRPTTETVPLPGRVDFELVNRSQSAVEGYSNEWRLLRFEDDAWTGVAHADRVDLGGPLRVGDRRKYTLRVFCGDPVPCDGGVDVGHVDPGRYAFSVGYGPGDRLCATLLEVVDSEGRTR